VRSLRQMSYTNWEWIIVDDGSTKPECTAQLDVLCAEESRVQVIDRKCWPGGGAQCSGPPCTGQISVADRQRYMLEPTFAEKCLWFLEHSLPLHSVIVERWLWTVNYLWQNGFEKNADFLYENWVTPMALIRRAVHEAIGATMRAVSYEHADWDYWLTMAQHGYWGYTLPEYLIWYRRQDTSLLEEIEKDRKRTERFFNWLQKKHKGLATRFPKPKWIHGLNIPLADIQTETTITNPLASQLR